MDDYNYQMHSRNENDAMEQLQFNCENSFINRSEFSSSDVERVLMEAHESILGTMEPIGSCQDTNSFLNPINDILGDICEFNKNYGCSNSMSANPQQIQQTISNPLNALNCSWPLTEPPSSVIGVATPMQHISDNVTSDSGFFNISSASDGQLLLPENTEYSNPDCSFLSGDYASSFNQLFQTLEQQQLSFMSTPIAAITHPNAQTTHNFSDVFLSTIGSLPASTTITPITVEERQIGHRTLSPVQQEVTIEARFIPDRGTKRNLSDGENFAPSVGHISSHILPAHQYISQHYDENARIQNCFIKRNSLYSLETVPQTIPQQHKVIAVLNQNQSSEMVAPLPICGASVSNQNLCLVSTNAQSPSSASTIANTPTSKRLAAVPKNRFNWTAVFPRKHFIHPPEMIIMHPLRTRKLIAARSGISNSTTVDLAEYFDTSSISIPMIRERSRSEIKNENRRKQKLNIIPGAENFIFEIQRNEDQDIGCSISNLGTKSCVLERDLYPETELPELEEIFKRKKKTTASTTSISKKTNVCPPVVAGPPQKRQCTVNVINEQSSVQESSNSFDEKISMSIAIRQGRSKILLDRIDNSSETDSGESDDEMVLGAKSLKCHKCMKLFKTTRSLAIHTKRCLATSIELCSTTNMSTDNDGYIYTNAANNRCKVNQNQIEEISLDICLVNEEDQKVLKLIGSSDEMKARPITRSQTRRSTGRVIRAPNATKRSK